MRVFDFLFVIFETKFKCKSFPVDIVYYIQLCENLRTTRLGQKFTGSYKKKKRVHFVPGGVSR